LKGKNLKLTSSDKLKEVFKTRNLTDQQKKFINKEWDKHEIKDPENFDNEINTFIDNGISKYKEYADIYGVKTEDTKEKEGGAPPQESKDSNERDDRGYLKTNPIATTDI